MHRAAVNALLFGCFACGAGAGAGGHAGAGAATHTGTGTGAHSGAGGSGGSTSTCPNVVCNGVCCGLDDRCAAHGCLSGCQDGDICGDECIGLDGDLNHCGSCDTVCATGPHATPSCTNRTCAIACDLAYADCDGAAATGCERDLASDPAHCGACKAACPAGTLCAAGACHEPPTRLYAHVDGAVTSLVGFAIGAGGALAPLPGLPLAVGGKNGMGHHADPIAVCGDALYTVDDATGAIAAFHLQPDGALVALAGSPFQGGARAASLACGPAASHLYTTGQNQSVRRFRILAGGALVDEPAGAAMVPMLSAGLAFEPVGSRLYVASFATGLSVFGVDALGALTLVSQVAEPGGAHRSVAPSPGARFVAIEHTKGVRIVSALPADGPVADPSACARAGFAWTPDGAWLYAGHLDCTPAVVTPYALTVPGAAATAGSPFATGGPEDAGPVALVVDPSGTRLFVGHESGSIAVLALAPDGSATPIAGSPFAAGAMGAVRGLALR